MRCQISRGGVGRSFLAAPRARRRRRDRSIRLGFVIVVALAALAPARAARAITWCHDWTIYKVTGRDGNRQAPQQLLDALTAANYAYYDSFRVKDADKFDDKRWINPDAVTISNHATALSVTSDHRLRTGDVILVGDDHSGLVVDASGRIDHFLQPPTLAEGQGQAFAPADAERDGNFKRGWTLPQILLFERKIYPTGNAPGAPTYQHPYLRDEVKIYRPRDPRWAKLMQALTDQGLKLTDARGNFATGTITLTGSRADGPMTTTVTMAAWESQSAARDALQRLAGAAAPGIESFDVAGGKGQVSTGGTDIPPPPAPAQVRKVASATADYAGGDVLVRISCVRDGDIAPTPSNPDETTKFLNDIAALKQESKTTALQLATNLDKAMSAGNLYAGVDHTAPLITLDRPDGARFSALRVSGVGFGKTTSSADAVHVNIMWEGKEVYRINMTDRQGRIPAAWIHVPDDAPFGVNRVWGEEGATGRKSAVVQFTADKLMAKELVDHLDALGQSYVKDIPANDRWYGSFRSGRIRNIHNAGRSIAAGVLWLPTALFTLGHYQDDLWPDNKFVCSWYQAETLEMLNRVRFSMDPTCRAWLDGFDYGPFMSGPTDVAWLSHHFAVVWPRATAMDPEAAHMGGFPSDPVAAAQTTGLAFDPWPQQVPTMFEVKSGSAAWAESSIFADRWKKASYTYILPRPTPDKITTDGKPLFKGQYPITGGDYYATNFRTAADLEAILKDERAGEPAKMVGVRSPVRLEMTAAAGGTAGRRADGSELNTINGCEIALVKQPDGHDEWYADLPDGQVTLTITGTGDGSFALLTKQRGRPAQQYPAVPVHDGTVCTIVLTDAEQPAPLHTPDGKDLLPSAMPAPSTQPGGPIASAAGPTTSPSAGTGGSSLGSSGPSGAAGTGAAGTAAAGTGTAVTGEPGTVDITPGTGQTGGTSPGSAGSSGTGTGTASAATGGSGTTAIPTAGAAPTSTATTSPAGTGTTATAAGGGLSTGKGLAIARWHTIRRITNFPRGDDVKFIVASKISGNGSRIVFAAQQGCFTIRPDGTGLVRLSDKPCQMIDISRDGSRVAWCEGRDALFVGAADGGGGGGGREQMPGGLNVVSMRLTADGSKLFVLVPEKDGIFVLPADGTDVKKVNATEPVCKLLGTETNANHWRSLDVSDDGTRLAFNLLLDVFTCNADGSDLRQVTHNKQYAIAPTGYRISGDGRRVDYFRASRETSAMVFCDTGGGGAVEIPQPWAEIRDLAPSRDGGQVAASWGVRLFNADGRTFYDALDTGPEVLSRPCSISLTDDLRRAVVQIDGPVSVDQGAPSQLAVIDFSPASLAGCPALRDVTAKPRFLPNDGSTSVALSANAGDPELKQIGAVLIRNGAEDPDMKTFFALHDDGANGDAKAGDGTYANNALLLHTNSGKPMKPGPITLRLHAMNKAGNVTVVDLDGLEVRQP
jgi:hypothetical protein